jgi:hypothetical protein
LKKSKLSPILFGIASRMIYNNSRKGYYLAKSIINKHRRENKWSNNGGKSQ